MSVITQLLIGTAVIALTIVIQAELYNLLSHRYERLVNLARRRLGRFANTGIITTSVLFVMLVHSVNVWIWALVFLALGAFQELEPALYFSLVAFTTVGFGDITLDPDWRLLSGLTAANGFLTFGWSTAYMIALARKAG